MEQVPVTGASLKGHEGSAMKEQGGGYKKPGILEKRAEQRRKRKKGRGGRRRKAKQAQCEGSRQHRNGVGEEGGHTDGANESQDD